MLTTAKFAIAAALVLGAALSASAATRAQVAKASQNQATSSDVIPGYGRDGSPTAIPNPDR